MKKRLIAGLSALMIMVSGVSAYAAELPYSSNWETQADNSWKYKLSTGGYASGWIQDEVDQNWYYMNSSQVMLSGLVKSNNNKYYLLSQVHDGHFGRMLTNGMTYNGITIQAETSGDYVGALSQTTLNQLRSLGLTVEGAQDVSGSQHVTGGQIVNDTTSQNNQTNGGQIDISKMTNEELERWLEEQSGSGLGSGIGHGAEISGHLQG